MIKSGIIGLVLASMVGVMAIGNDVPGHPNGPGFAGPPVPGIQYEEFKDEFEFFREGCGPFWFEQECLAFF